MKQFIVIGLGRFGFSVAKTLSEKGYDVLAIDKDEGKVQELANIVTHTVQTDATDENSLQTLGVSNFDVAVVSIGEDVHSNILATLILKQLGVKHVVVKAQDRLHGKVLSKVGADKIVYPERDMGTRIANNLISSNMLDYIEFAPDYSVIEIQATDKMDGKNLEELELRSRFGVNVMAIKTEDGLEITPEAKQIINRGDVLIVIGNNKSLEKLRSF
ncbi:MULTISPECIES: potassium channel family protein [unclassified Candidatus Frackibacter]|uniref:potassium channel family protein n=1 Tax=unclassified Candidatus Frackibacter TaxID=2648818 RepID=UPI00088136F7|nr:MULTISPECIES: TrkA family potassium uptake protein [unclassified Candidatus Frackibacter]SDC29465.1 trk system potassium uptake protein TrkA [Candidatus Frackibacter sp. WG11]SEM94293.1 trk system potassium uptake protein TrkA [Candidatus Frackibacter sp. WG12]SFL57270.1 trk system potassium uptake protein TrkA [Candidatus Frackibacter sp. WG13]